MRHYAADVCRAICFRCGAADISLLYGALIPCFAAAMMLLSAAITYVAMLRAAIVIDAALAARRAMLARQALR